MAEWQGILGLLEGQGIVFWAAAAAASLGVALLVAAGAVASRRFLSRVRLPSRRRIPDSAPVARATEGGYVPATAPVRPPVAAGDIDKQQLINRLRAAADRLAELQKDSRDRESPLKGTTKDVDYVFKSGIG